MSDQVGNPEDRFSHNEAHFILRCRPLNRSVGVISKIAIKSKKDAFVTRDFVSLMVRKIFYDRA